MFRKTIAVILVVCLAVVSGCSRATAPVEGNTIATSFYPIYIFTLNLVDGIEDVTVTCMAEQSVGCLHDYTITAEDARIIADADVLVINGAGMEGFIEDIYTSAEDLTIIDSSKGITLLCGDSHEGHDHGDHFHEQNSHIWMSVTNAKLQVTNIKNGLVESFPHLEAQIESNYAEYISRLDALASEIEAASQYVSEKPVVTFHDAYAYLAEDMGFHVVDTVESDEGVEPSARDLARLADEIAEHNVTALYIEPDYSGSAAEILSRETGVAVYTLNPVIKGDVVLTAYEDIMRENIRVIVG